MRYLLALCVLAFAACQSSSSDTIESLDYKATVLQQRAETDSVFRIPGESPLPGMEAIAAFSGLAYFPVDSSYRIEADWERMRNQEPFVMPTTGDHDNSYILFGKAYIVVTDKKDTLNIYQNLELAKEGRLEESLFIPFRDSTTGISTYGGGRYLNLAIPDDDKIVIDFNLAYNPYCVYNYKYSCPIPPEENYLSMPIKAGEKMIEIPQP